MTKLENVQAALVRELHGLCKYELEPRIYEQIARSAVEAMREPTPAMVEAAMGALNRHIDGLPKELRAKTKEPGGYVLVNHIEKHAIRYRAMVDAILNEKPETK